MRIIDISEFNGKVDFAKVKDSAVDGIIIRAGYRGSSYGTIVKDKKFDTNITGAVGFPVGIYFVTQAITEPEAREEARFCLDLIKDFDTVLGVYWDSENHNGKGRADAGKLSKAHRTDLAVAFCQELEAHGVRAGVYASLSWFNNYLDISRLKKYKLWVAKYSSIAPNIAYDGWQFTDKGKVNGISGNVDISTFTDFMQGLKDEEIIEAPKEEPAEETKEVYYTIKKGDTLSSIAKRYGKTVAYLQYENGIKDANKIYVGQKIKIN